MEQPRQRRRFVQDGEVPVVMLNADTRADAAAQAGDRIAELEAALGLERNARAATTRSLEEARATIQSLQTRLAHAEMASTEAVAAERRAREEAERALREATTIIAAPKVAEPPELELFDEPPMRRTRAKRTVAAKPAKPLPVSKPRDSQPVKWWLPGFSAKKSGR
jgi:hypothetical protein